MATRMQISQAVQTNSVHTPLLASYISNIIMRGKDLNAQWQIALQSLQQSRSQLNQANDKTECLNNAISDFSDTIDKLNVQTLQQNVAVAEKSLTNQKLRREIADLQSIIEIHKWETQTIQGSEEITPVEHRFQTLPEIREERRNLEQQLYKVNYDIEMIFEDVFENENKLENIERLRHSMRIENDQSMEKLQASCRTLDDRKKRLLSLGVSDQQSVSLSGLYASPNELQRLRQDVNLLKNRQSLIERQIEEQMQEKEYMESNMTELMRKQHELECLIRKENGDDGNKAPISPPQFRQHNLGGPNIWFVTPILTLDLQRMFLNDRYEEFSSPCSEQRCVITEINSSSSSEDVKEKTRLKDKEEQLLMSYI
ncbi:hypothetical protein ACJMK2_020755 [Sinanodonta woodiana]|uniref:Uncharacterized protein n=1 Tax=Sinanodonta woodiana TaxID=1069815 RepID=A0ABD3U019_SINWO